MGNPGIKTHARSCTSQSHTGDRTRSSTTDSNDRDPRSNPDEFGTSAGLVRRCFAAWCRNGGIWGCSAGPVWDQPQRDGRFRT